MPSLLSLSCVALAIASQTFATQLIYPAKYIAANLSMPTGELAERDIFIRASCNGAAPCGTGCCDPKYQCCGYGFCAPEGNTCCTGNYNCAPGYGCCQPGSCFPNTNGEQCCSDGSYCDGDHYCGVCPDSNAICCFGQTGGAPVTASRLQVINSTQTYTTYATETGSYSQGVSTSSGPASNSGSASAGAQYYYTTFTYYQVIYFQSTGAATTSMDSSTITKQTLLSAYASNSQDAASLLTSLERSVQAHASATTSPGAGPGAAPSSSASSSTGAAAAFGFPRHSVGMTDIPMLCLMAMGGVAGVLAVIL